MRGDPTKNRITSSLERPEKANYHVYLFVFAAALMMLTFFYKLLQDPTGLQMRVIFSGGNDFMADFLNVTRYASFPNPYLAEGIPPSELAYFPFVYWIMRFFTGLCGYGVEGISHNVGIFVSGLAMNFAAVLLFLQLYKLISFRGIVKIILLVTIIFSSIFLFSYERGNLILFSAAFVLFYLCNYKNKSKVLKELSFVSLAMAVALKGYPGIFVLVLVYEKKFVEALRVCLYSAVLLFVPFLFLEGGFSNVPILLNNLEISTDTYRMGSFKRFGLGYIVSNVLKIGKDPGGVGTLKFFESITKGMSFLSIIVAPFLRYKWKKIAVITCVLIMLPVNSAFYSGLYLLPVVVMFLNETNEMKSRSFMTWIYCILFMFIITPLQFSEISLYIPNMSVFTLWIIILLDGLICTLNSLKKRWKAK